MKRQIEFRVLLDLARNRILPAVLRHQNGLLENVSKLREVLGSEADDLSVAQIAMIKEAGALVQRIHTLSDELEAKHDAVEAADHAMARAEGFAQDLLPLMDELGDCCSALESIVDDAVWPLPKFGELLFTR